MEVPKYIDKILEQRARCAERFIALDNILVNWLEKKGIPVSNDDILTGACSICEPWSSIYSIRECIREAGKEDGRD